MKRNQYRKLIRYFIIICACMMPFSVMNVHASEYDIIFKAGAHGTVNGEKSISYRLSGNDIFPNEPDVKAEQGYVFTGWSKELPSVGSVIEGKEVYVAKYGVVINGINYTIHYVDENKVDIATQRSMLGEKGDNYTIRAKNISGYTYQESEKTFTLNEDNQNIYIMYTLTDPSKVERFETVTEYEQVNQAGAVSRPNTQNPPVGNENENNAGNTKDNEVEIENNEQPQGNGEVDIPDNQQPLAKGSVSDLMGISIGTGVAVLAVLGLSLFIIRKRKQNME